MGSNNPHVRCTYPFYAVLRPFSIKKGYVNENNKVEFEAGDIALLNSMAHGFPVRISSTKPTTYVNHSGPGTASLIESGHIRVVTQAEFLAIEPHLTKRIWLFDTQAGILEQRRAWNERENASFKLNWPHKSKLLTR